MLNRHPSEGPHDPTGNGRSASHLSPLPEAVPERGEWSLSTEPAIAAGPGAAASITDRVRPRLEQALERDPARREFAFQDGLLLVRLRAVTWQPGMGVRLVYRGPGASCGPGKNNSAGPAHVGLAVPRPDFDDLERQLIGVEPVLDDIVLRLQCRFGGLLDQWRASVGAAVPERLRARLAQSGGVFILQGPPGCGKTSTAKAAANRLSRLLRRPGTLFHVGTETRGNGHVGDLSNQVRAAFTAAREAALEGPATVLVDEAETMAVRRSEAHAHHEDRCGCGTAIQILDELASENLPLMVIFTTNLIESIDPAILRRAVIYRLSRPDRSARRELLSGWIPGLQERLLERATAQCAGMSFSDIEQALERAFLSALAAGEPLQPRDLPGLLRRARRTEDV